MAVLVPLILTLVLFRIVAALPWWSLSEGGVPQQVAYLGEFCYIGGCQGYGVQGPLHDAFVVTIALVLGANLLAVLTTLLFLSALSRPRLGTGALVSGVLGSFLLLVAPFYLYVAFPEAYPSLGFYSISFVTSFFGSDSMYTWGAGSGWWLAFALVVVFLWSTGGAHSLSEEIRLVGPRRASLTEGTGQTHLHGEDTVLDEEGPRSGSRGGRF